MRPALLDASLRVAAGVVAGLLVVVTVFDGPLRAALAVGLVVGGAYALAGAAYERF